MTTSLKQQLERATTLLSEMKNPDGTKLFARIGSPLQFGQEDDLPRATFRAGGSWGLQIYWDIVICRLTDPQKDEEKVIAFLDALQASGNIDWIGKIHYECCGGIYYRTASCHVKEA